MTTEDLKNNISTALNKLINKGRAPLRVLVNADDFDKLYPLRNDKG